MGSVSYDGDVLYLVEFSQAWVMFYTVGYVLY